jgi:hypothetical protein
MICHPGTGKGGIPGGTEETRLHDETKRNNRRGLGPVEVGQLRSDICMESDSEVFRSLMRCKQLKLVMLRYGSSLAK